MTNLRFVPSVSTNTAFASIGLPLASEPSAIAFVVVIVGGSVEAVPRGCLVMVDCTPWYLCHLPPHGGSTGRFYKPAMPMDVHHQQGKQHYRHLHPHLDINSNYVFILLFNVYHCPSHVSPMAVLMSLDLHPCKLPGLSSHGYAPDLKQRNH